MGLLDNQAAIVTGAGSGIGRAIALEYAREGAKVVVADRNIDGAEETAKTIQSNGGEAIALDLDVRKEDSVRSMVERSLEAFGNIDILVNNAGIAGRRRPTTEQPFDHWQRVIHVNVDGPFLCCKHLGSHLIERGKGSVINIASIAGLSGWANAASYGPSKAAVANFTQQMAVEWGPLGIRVNAIAPGFILSDYAQGEIAAGRANADRRAERAPLGRLGDPRDIASVAVFLASDLSRFVTGTVIPVDGGIMAQGPSGL